jgi:hypothetical protein
MQIILLKLHPLLEKICIIVVSSCCSPTSVGLCPPFLEASTLYPVCSLKTNCKGLDARELLKITSLLQSQIAQHKETGPTHILYLRFKSTP